MSLMRTKPIDQLLADGAQAGEATLKPTLGAWALVALGIGGIIGAGLFVRTAAAIADRAGTYSYATMGELVAWIIGWDLVLEYAVGAATVAIAWSEYFNRVLGLVGLHIPYQWCHSPLEHSVTSPEHGIANLPAVAILFLLSALLIRGTRE